MSEDNSQKAADALKSAFARKPETAAAHRAEEALESPKASRLEAAAEAAAAEPTPPPAPEPEPAPAGVQHTVQSGETLSHISLHYYKTANRWKEIYEANKAVIGDNPNRIYPGQVLVIPNA